jgi:hypothetical protein
VPDASANEATAAAANEFIKIEAEEHGGVPKIDVVQVREP